VCAGSSDGEALIGNRFRPTHRRRARRCTISQSRPAEGVDRPADHRGRTFRYTAERPGEPAADGQEADHRLPRGVSMVPRRGPFLSTRRLSEGAFRLYRLYDIQFIRAEGIAVSTRHGPGALGPPRRRSPNRRVSEATAAARVRTEGLTAAPWRQIPVMPAWCSRRCSTAKWTPRINTAITASQSAGSGSPP